MEVVGCRLRIDTWKMWQNSRLQETWGTYIQKFFSEDAYDEHWSGTIAPAHEVNETVKHRRVKLDNFLLPITPVKSKWINR